MHVRPQSQGKTCVNVGFGNQQHKQQELGLWKPRETMQKKSVKEELKRYLAKQGHWRKHGEVASGELEEILGKAQVQMRGTLNATE